MNATERYQLKLKIDEALRQVGASAVSWETTWSQLVIRKYDHPYSASRSVVFERFIKDEADWQAQRPHIEQELAALARQPHFTRKQVEAFVREVHTPHNESMTIEIACIETFPELPMPFWKVSYDLVDHGLRGQEYRTRLVDLVTEHQGIGGIMLWPLVGKELLS